MAALSMPGLYLSRPDDESGFSVPSPKIGPVVTQDAQASLADPTVRRAPDSDAEDEALRAADAAVAKAAKRAALDETRPICHFRAPGQWMNDLVGLIRNKNGVVHVFYQFNPFDYRCEQLATIGAQSCW